MMKYVISPTLAGITFTQKGLQLYLKHLEQKTYLYGPDGAKLNGVPTNLLGVRILTKDFGDSITDIPFAEILPYTFSLGEIPANDMTLLHLLYIYGKEGIFTEDVHIVDI